MPRILKDNPSILSLSSGNDDEKCHESSMGIGDLVCSWLCTTDSTQIDFSINGLGI